MATATEIITPKLSDWNDDDEESEIEMGVGENNEFLEEDPENEII